MSPARAAAKKIPACKGCGSTSRELSKPGPRCATCWRAETKRRKEETHERRVMAVYGLNTGEYRKLYEGQGGKCALCLVATGRSKRLAVDHDHATGEVRGILCSPCNSVLAHETLRPGTLQRAIDYLANPPARSILGRTP